MQIPLDFLNLRGNIDSSENNLSKEKLMSKYLAAYCFLASRLTAKAVIISSSG
ncbi:hypothetical protein PMIT1303_00920 [Prochlorococcus sp. MIT 1303]|nr:hypothetical protein PMIT1303_00920 [Prochlorococcus sp. MIT 1303]